MSIQGKNPTHQAQVYSCGIMAREILLSYRGSVPARVMGVTSRGLYLHLPDEQVIFLSYEKYRGPLTLNLANTVDRLQRYQVGDPAIVDAERIAFPASDLEVDTSRALPYTCRLPELPVRVVFQSHEDLLRRDLPVDLGPVRWRIEQAARTWKAGDTAGVIGALGGVLGLGIGLTPSGDDLVLGFLLTINRWGSRLWSDNRDEARLRSVDIISSALVNHGRQATGMLSSVLMKCAQRGLADERLVQALDGIVTGVPGVEQCADGLSAYGASSGWDALVGMSLALTLD